MACQILKTKLSGHDLFIIPTPILSLRGIQLFFGWMTWQSHLVNFFILLTHYLRITIKKERHPPRHKNRQHPLRRGIIQLLPLLRWETGGVLFSFSV
jgi:hypothetical protein